MPNALNKKQSPRSSSTRRCKSWKIEARAPSRQKKAPPPILFLAKRKGPRFCAGTPFQKWLKSWRRSLSVGVSWAKKTNTSTRRQPNEVSEMDVLITVTDKERYWSELKALDGLSKNLYKPKKCLSAYMIFVKEVSRRIIFLTLFCRHDQKLWLLTPI